MKLLIGIFFLFLSAFSVLIYAVGSHGHLMFRPHMTEDWVLWGATFTFGLIGLFLIISFFFRKKN